MASHFRGPLLGAPTLVGTGSNWLVGGPAELLARHAYTQWWCDFELPHHFALPESAGYASTRTNNTIADANPLPDPTAPVASNVLDVYGWMRWNIGTLTNFQFYAANHEGVDNNNTNYGSWLSVYAAQNNSGMHVAYPFWILTVDADETVDFGFSVRFRTESVSLSSTSFFGFSNVLGDTVGATTSILDSNGAFLAGTNARYLGLRVQNAAASVRLNEADQANASVTASTTITRDVPHVFEMRGRLGCDSSVDWTSGYVDCFLDGEHIVGEGRQSTFLPSDLSNPWTLTMNSGAAYRYLMPTFAMVRGTHAAYRLELDYIGTWATRL